MVNSSIGKGKDQIGDSRQIAISCWLRHQRFSNYCTREQVLGALAQHGCGHEALEVLEGMIAGGVHRIESSYEAASSACSHAGVLDDGRRLFWL